jgi:hypothetical protein
MRTKGSDWLRNNGGRCWAKLLRNSGDVSLYQFGGYAIQGLMVGFDRPVMMEPNSFLFVASDYPIVNKVPVFDHVTGQVEITTTPVAVPAQPTGPGWGGKRAQPPGMDYRFALIRRAAADSAFEVPDDEIHRHVSQLMKEGRSGLPAERYHAAFDNPQYTAAIYCKSIFEQTAPAALPAALPLPAAVTEVIAPLAPVTRRISRGILGTPKAQVAAQDKAQDKLPISLSRFGRRPRKPPPES